MCGVVGIFEFFGSATAQLPDAIKMARLLSHRGPDDEGFVVFDRQLTPQVFWGQATPESVREAYPEARDSDGVNLESQVALGHRRLSILDISPAGHQPMRTPDGRYWIVFNGEVYNYVELRAELLALGYAFRTESDTEVILAAYVAWGTECARRFNGDWALLIYDAVDHKLFVSRDRFGIKPLYYYQDESGIIFASEVKALLAHSRVQSGPDEDVLRNYLIMGATEWREETPFKNIRRFPFAHSVVIDLSKGGGWRAQQYFELRANSSRERFDPEKAKQYADEYYSLLTDAVRIRLRSDVPIGCALSGGLDSSSIAYIADRLLKNAGQSKPLSTFSMVHLTPETKHCDESFYVDILQKQLGFDSYRKEPKVGDIPTLLGDVHRHWESPPEGTGMAGMVTVGIARDVGLTVTLDGQGADEVQAGYEQYIVSYLANLPWSDLWSELAAINSTYQGSMSHRVLLMTAAIGVKIFGRGSVNLVLRLMGRNFSLRHNSLNEELRASVTESLVNLIHYADARSMYYSIESRMPFMDHRLIEFSLSVPSCYKIHRGYTKYFARLAFDGKLPEQITWRKDKMGWPVPIAQWFDGPLGAWASQTIADSRLATRLQSDSGGQPKSKGLTHRIRLLNVAVWEKTFWSGKLYGKSDDARLAPSRA